MLDSHMCARTKTSCAHSWSLELLDGIYQLHVYILLLADPHTPITLQSYDTDDYSEASVVTFAVLIHTTLDGSSRGTESWRTFANFKQDGGYKVKTSQQSAWSLSS
jgi:hypothetical protein